MFADSMWDNYFRYKLLTVLILHFRPWGDIYFLDREILSDISWIYWCKYFTVTYLMILFWLY